MSINLTYSFSSSFDITLISFFIPLFISLFFISSNSFANSSSSIIFWCASLFYSIRSYSFFSFSYFIISPFNLIISKCFLGFLFLYSVFVGLPWDNYDSLARLGLFFILSSWSFSPSFSAFSACSCASASAYSYYLLRSSSIALSRLFSSSTGTITKRSF